MQAETIISRNQQTLAYSAISRLNGYKIKRSENRSNLTCYSEHPTNNQADSVTINALCKSLSLFLPLLVLSLSPFSLSSSSNWIVVCLNNSSNLVNLFRSHPFPSQSQFYQVFLLLNLGSYTVLNYSLRFIKSLWLSFHSLHFFLPHFFFYSLSNSCIFPIFRNRSTNRWSGKELLLGHGRNGFEDWMQNGCES